ncbi:calcium uptake protein, mitochondrial-like [Andrographis paniculata]|uniref:calcium uptake protein, mitochondrial-like n=1 Tax=Andrographis paniculata TaxID=175694 RepID=UPI0021E8BF7A|nr:calcium uptake protein, mitochondrial-like [Andrographis paniculata]
MSLYAFRRPPSPSLSLSLPLSTHCLPCVPRFHCRYFSIASRPPQYSDFPDTSNHSVNTTALKWISAGIFTCSTLALSFYTSLGTAPFPSHADSCEPAPPASTTASLSQPSPPNQNNGSKFLLGDAYRRRVFFNYEKRIRMRSPPEKVFEYFASIRNDEGEIFMTPADLMRAVVPVFPPSESLLVRDGYLRGERSPGELQCSPSQFFMLFDTNGDGLISFKEYLFFVTLLSIPESSFSVAFKMFDLDCNGQIDREEFMKVMTLMRTHNRQGAVHSDGLRAGHKLQSSVENEGLLEYFFGRDGEKLLQHDKFVHFLRDLHDEMVKLEFAHYDYKSQGSISVKDFALSMVASADLKHLNRLLDRVDDLDMEPSLASIRISPEEFKNFAEVRIKLQPFSLAIFSFGEINGLLTRNDLQRAAHQVCGISLTDNVVDVIFHVFDVNKDGSLSSDEFVRVLYKRERDLAQPMEEGIFSFLSCYWHCSSANSITRFS